VAIYALRELKTTLRHRPTKQLDLSLSPEVVNVLLHEKESLKEIEDRFKTRINLISNPALQLEEIRIS
jgi:Ribonuclease G/E